jgi:hypothetical protein
LQPAPDLKSVDAKDQQERLAWRWPGLVGGMRHFCYGQKFAGAVKLAQGVLNDQPGGLFRKRI